MERGVVNITDGTAISYEAKKEPNSVVFSCSNCVKLCIFDSGFEVRIDVTTGRGN